MSTNQTAIQGFRKLLEAKRVPMYHSVFSTSKTGEHAGQWGHVFDADDKEDARYEADNERRQGQKVKVFTVPKHDARWHERDIQHYVTCRLAGLKHDEIPKKPKTIGEATDPNLTWSPFNNYSAWERNAKHRGLTVYRHTNPGGKTTPYFSAKDKEGNHRGHFDDHTKKGELAESSLTEAKAPTHVATVKAHTHNEVSRTKDGHVMVRKGYFYRSGGTSEGFANGISNKLTAAGVKHTVVDHGDHWAPFRGNAKTAKSSHWWVKLKLHDNVSEEFLSELSKKTLGNYAYKAGHSYGLNLVRATEQGRTREKEEKAWAATGKRDRGIRRALSRLTGQR